MGSGGPAPRLGVPVALTAAQPIATAAQPIAVATQPPAVERSLSLARRAKSCAPANKSKSGPLSALPVPVRACPMAVPHQVAELALDLGAGPAVVGRQAQGRRSALAGPGRAPRRRGCRWSCPLWTWCTPPGEGSRHKRHGNGPRPPRYKVEGYGGSVARRQATVPAPRSMTKRSFGENASWRRGRLCLHRGFDAVVLQVGQRLPSTVGGVAPAGVLVYTTASPGRTPAFL